MQGYFCLYPADLAFGASGNAYGCRWVGASQCNPEYESAEMDKAVRWALASAVHTQVAALTAFVLPYWPSTAYHRWLRHPFVHIMAKVRRSEFRFKKPDHWQGGGLYGGNPYWDVLFLVVANAAGISEYVRADELHAGFAAASLEVGMQAITITAPSITKML